MNIPTFDFRGNKFVNEDGTLTDVAQAFMDALINSLIQGVGQEGFETSQQSADNITTIQDNTTTSNTGLVTKTCKFGTLIYDETNNLEKVCLNDGSGNPIFKTIMTL